MVAPRRMLFSALALLVVLITGLGVTAAQPPLRPEHGLPVVQRWTPPPAGTGTAAPLPGSKATPVTSLLDEVGHFARTPLPGEVSAWKQELLRGKLSAARASQLHLWLGEWELGDPRHG